MQAQIDSHTDVLRDYQKEKEADQVKIKTLETDLFKSNAIVQEGVDQLVSLEAKEKELQACQEELSDLKAKHEEAVNGIASKMQLLTEKESELSYTK